MASPPEAPAISLRRALLGTLATAFAAGVARMATALGLAQLLGADVASPDPAVRRDGWLVGAGVLAGSLVGTAVLAVVARPALRRALALERPSAAAVVGWLLAAAALTALFDGVAALSGRPLVEPAWVDAYRTAPVALLAVALVSTSIFEELCFRGLLQTRLAATRLGPAGALALTAILFTLTHGVDDAWRFLEVLASAVLLGAARQQSGSSITGMVPHVLGNLKVLATIALTT